jgi:hypothetical protein
MRNNSSNTKTMLSSSQSTSHIKSNNNSEPFSNFCPLVTEKIIQVVPITLYSTGVNKPKSVKKDNDIKNLLMNSKSKSYYVTKNSIIPTCQLNKAMSNQVRMTPNLLENKNIKVKKKEDESIEGKESSFMSNSKCSVNSRISSNNKSDIPGSFTQRSFTADLQVSILNSEKGNLKEDESLNDEEGENLSTNSVSELNEGNIILDDFFILEEKMGFIKTVYF